MTTTNQHDVVVVGAGLAGLAAGQLSRRAGLSVVVLDPHPGGRARTDERQGYLFNRGPRALYRGRAGERVLKTLAVTYRGGPPPSVDGAISVGGLQFGLPSSPATMVVNRYLGMRDKVSLAKLFARLPRLLAADFASISVTDFLDGLTDRARMIALLGIRTSTYTDRPDELSAEAGIDSLQGKGVLYLDGGWQRLVDQLTVGLDLRSETAVSVGDGTVVTDIGEHHAATVIVATGTPAAAAGLLGRPSFDLAPPVEAACLDLGLTVRPTPPLLLAIDEPRYFSCHSPSARLSPDGTSVAHVLRYLSADDHLGVEAQRSELAAFAAAAGVQPDHIAASRYLHRMTVSGTIPAASTGGFAGRPAITDTGHTGVLLAGDWVGPESLLADASFASAEAAAHAAVTRSARQPIAS